MKTETRRIITQLKELARLYDVQTSYFNVNHRRSVFPDDSLLGVLKALGAQVVTVNDVPRALRERKHSLSRRIIEPVNVAWNGAKPEIRIYLPKSHTVTALSCRLETEAGERSEWKVNLNDLPVLSSIEAEGVQYFVRSVVLPEVLPFGYHKFSLEAKGFSAETLIISAPQKTYSPARREGKKEWGVFLPLYALRTKDGWGSGDYTAMEKLGEGIAGLGGNILATLPLLPAFLNEPFEPGPYAPVSRLMWNEFYIDMKNIPELENCAPARALMQSAGFRKEIEALQAEQTVDYRKIMFLKRRVMTELSRYFFSSDNRRLAELEQFVKENPVVETYARFRAVVDKRHQTWNEWPERLRDGEIGEGDYNKEDKDYHLYAQWIARQQVQALAENSRKRNIKLYFDLPLGVHAGGFDAWHYRDIFAAGATAGAPPDAVFTGGQNWWCPPLHPQKIREQGYRYVVDYLRHHLRYASMLRIDHVMGMHRLYWIPRGAEPGRGVYVRYHADELYAVLAVESQRSRSVIVGEDLGIVPSYVRPAMSRHGLHRMYILYYEILEKASGKLNKIPPATVAALNTHDMPPFAAFWRESDIGERKQLGLVNEKGMRRETKERRMIKAALEAFLRGKKYLKKPNPGARDMLEACLAYLSASRSRFVLVNLEDLWQETKAQNVPGVGDKYPSWKNKARYSLEEFLQSEEVLEILKDVDNNRKLRAGKEG
jgi:4-alpha-glucanotransferase